MLKALFKKQFLELNSFYFRNRKTGKNRSKTGTLIMVGLFMLLFAAIAFAFFGVSTALGSTLFEAKLEWLYFALLGLMSVFLGTFGSVFNTYAGLYMAKDNELLLSMPIPPRAILFVRMTGVYAMGLMYTSIVWIPSVIFYWLYGYTTAAQIAMPVLMLFLITLLVTVLTCVLGWVVALISARLKNKSFVTVLASLAFLGAYYFVYFRFNSLLTSVIANVGVIGENIKKWIYPIYQMGRGVTGEFVPAAIFAAMVIALFVIVYYVMSISFTNLITKKSGGKKTVYRYRETKTRGISAALISKELRRFTASPTYMLNTGLGLILLPVAAIAALIKQDMLRTELLPIADSLGISGMLPVVAAAVVCLASSMNCITAPSVSLEGKSLWIIRTMPVSTWSVLRAKLMMALILCCVPTTLCAAILGYVLKSGFINTILIIVCSLIFMWLLLAFGLMINLLKPNLTWTNETVPVKQGAPVMITLFGGWVVAIGSAVGYYFLIDYIKPELFLTLISLLFAGCALLTRLWLKTKGVRAFEAL